MQVFLLATATFVAMLMVTTSLPQGPYNGNHSYASWATLHALTSPLTALGWGLSTPPTVNFMAGHVVHIALWGCLGLLMHGVRRGYLPAGS